MLKDLFFFGIDKFLPRPLAAIPYNMALNSLKSALISEAQVWHRNSFYKKNYVFGVSDLDVTVLVNNHVKLRTILLKLEETKQLFPFLGETNLYLENEFQVFEPSLNKYERLRDPILSARMAQTPVNDKVEKIVFLLRMFYSDRKKLTNYPFLRQRKWKLHFNEMGLSCNKINYQDVIDSVVSLISANQKESNEIISAMNVLIEKDFSDELIFRRKLPDYWKYLFPHRYLWFENNREEDMSGFENALIKEICLRQIDWEIWGLMTQIPFIDINHDGFEIHIRRLLNLAKNLGDTSGIYQRGEALLRLRSDYRKFL